MATWRASFAEILLVAKKINTTVVEYDNCVQEEINRAKDIMSTNNKRSTVLISRFSLISFIAFIPTDKS